MVRCIIFPFGALSTHIVGASSPSRLHHEGPEAVQPCAQVGWHSVPRSSKPEGLQFPSAPFVGALILHPSTVVGANVPLVAFDEGIGVVAPPHGVTANIKAEIIDRIRTG